MVSVQVDHCHSSLFRQKEKEVRGTNDKELVRRACKQYNDFIYNVLIYDTCPKKHLPACVWCNKPITRF